MTYTSKEWWVTLIWILFIIVIYNFDLLFISELILSIVVPILLYTTIKFFKRKKLIPVDNLSSQCDNVLVDKINCPNCKTKIEDLNNRYCDQCGYDLNPPEIEIAMVCPKCHREYNESKKYCSDDGLKLEKKEIILEELTQSEENIKKVETHIKSNLENKSSQLIIDNNTEMDSINKNISQVKELGFFLGYIWVILATITGLILFFGGLMILRESNNGAFFGLSFPFFISAFGVYKRKLFLGLYFTNVLLIMNLFINIAMLLKISDNFFNYMLLLIIHTLWGVYFYSRRELFLN